MNKLLYDTVLALQSLLTWQVWELEPDFPSEGGLKYRDEDDGPHFMSVFRILGFISCIVGGVWIILVIAFIVRRGLQCKVGDSGLLQFLSQ